MLRIRGLYEIAIRVNDLARSEAFNRDTLGLEVGVQWRDGMSPALECAGPSIRFDVGTGSADARGWAPRLRDADWRVGLAAVLEDREGRMSHGALAHALEQPDFHRADRFTCDPPR